MNTIIQYLDSIFAPLEQTAQTQEIRTRIQNSMIEKYEDLIAEGMNDHEALGKVISEFGNIEDLIQEYQLQTQTDSSNPPLPELQQNQLNQYFHEKSQSIFYTSLGSSLMVFAVAGFMLLQSVFGSDNDVINLTGTALIIAAILPTVVCFYLADQKKKKFQWIEQGQFTLSSKIRQKLLVMQEAFKKNHSIANIIALSFILLPIIPIMIVSEMDVAENFMNLTVAVLLIGIGLAVLIFTYYSGQEDVYLILLNQDQAMDDEPTSVTEKIIEDIYWPIIILIYLIWSFLRGAWGYSWLIFVAAAILEDVIVAIFSLKKK